MDLSGHAGRLPNTQDGWTATLRAEHEASGDGIAVAISGRPLLRLDGPWRSIRKPADAILESYRSTGLDCLQKLDGQFALAIADSRARRVILAIDAMGIERLTYGFQDGLVRFGASASKVAADTSNVVKVNRNALLDYLMLHVVPAPETVFEGVRKLRGGWFALFENNTCRESPYRKIQFSESSGGSPRDFDRFKERLFETLRDATSACEPGERSGAFLSGGLDSSTVAGMLSELRGSDTRTFTIGFGVPDYDEFPYSRTANARFGCKPHEYVVQPSDVADGFTQIARKYDEPFGNSSALAVLFCARLAHANSVDHLLAGDGGDELFAGNSRYAEQSVFERYQLVPRLLRSALLEPALRLWPDAISNSLVRKARSYVQKANIPLPERLEAWNLLQRTGVSRVLHPEMLHHVDEGHTFKVMRELWELSSAKTPLNRMLTYDWQLTLADNDIRKVSGMCDVAGVRVSYPMLHPDVVQLSTEVPPALKMPGTRLREFYKRAMIGFLPDEIIHKKKHGFSLPIGLWLKTSPVLHDAIYDNLRSLRNRDIINPEFLDQLLQLHDRDDARYYGVFLWVLAMLEQWLVEHRLSA